MIPTQNRRMQKRALDENLEALCALLRTPLLHRPEVRSAIGHLKVANMALEVRTYRIALRHQTVAQRILRTLARDLVAQEDPVVQRIRYALDHLAWARRFTTDLIRSLSEAA